MGVVLTFVIILNATCSDNVNGEALSKNICLPSKVEHFVVEALKDALIGHRLLVCLAFIASLIWQLSPDHAFDLVLVPALVLALG